MSFQVTMYCLLFNIPFVNRYVISFKWSATNFHLYMMLKAVAVMVPFCEMPTTTWSLNWWGSHPKDSWISLIILCAWVWKTHYLFQTCDTHRTLRIFKHSISQNFAVTILYHISLLSLYHYKSYNQKQDLRKAGHIPSQWVLISFFY